MIPPPGPQGPSAADADRLARYVLGELSPDDEAVFEDMLLDNDAWAYVQVAEDELLAAYASGELDAARRQQIGDRIAASPRLRERLVLVRDLQTIAARRRVRGKGRRLAYAAAVIVAAAAVVLVVRGAGRGGPDTEIAALTLLPATRGVELPEIRLAPRSALALSVVIDAEEAFPRYRVRLRAPQPPGAQTAAWSQDDVVTMHGTLVLRVPGSAIGDGVHELEITGCGAGDDVYLGARSFRVVH